MQKRKLLVSSLIVLLVLTFFAQFYWIQPVYAIGGDKYKLAISVNKSWFRLGETANITVTSNTTGLSIPLSITNDSGTTVYNQNVSPNVTINYVVSASYGLYTVTFGNVTSWFWVQDQTNLTNLSLPYSWSWKGVAYQLLSNYSLVASTSDGQISVDWLSTLFGFLPSRTVTVTSNPSAIRLHIVSGSYQVDIWYCNQYRGLIFRANGTIPASTTLNWKINSDRATYHVSSIVSGSSLTYDWSDLTSQSIGFAILKSSSQLNVNIPANFDIYDQIFTDGFETNDFSAWTGQYKAGVSTTLTVQSTTKYAGGYAEQSHIAELGGYGIEYKDFVSTYAAAYVQFMVRFSATPASGKIVELGGLADVGDSNDLVLLQLYNNAGTLNWRLYYKTDAGSGTSDSATPAITINTWYVVEIHFHGLTSTGHVNAWIALASDSISEASPTISATGLTNDDVLAQEIKCGLYSDAALTMDSFYDNVIFDTTFLPFGIVSTNVNDFVDSNSTNVDSVASIGVQSNFTAQQSGPNNINDTLTESNVNPPSNSFGNPVSTGSSYSSVLLNALNGGSWPTGSTAQTVYNVTFYGAETGSGTRAVKAVICNTSGYILTNGVGSSVTVSGTGLAWYTSTFSTPPTILPSTNYTLMLVSDSAGFRISYSATSGGKGYFDSSNSYTTPTNPTDWANTNATNYQIYANTSYPAANYRLDIEEQFTSVDAVNTYTYKELCLFMGPNSSAETVYLQGWNNGNSSWTNITTSLTPNQWNNFSISAWLISYVNLTIHFLDGIQSSDTVQSNWQKDACLLHLWNVTGSFSATLTYSSSITYTFSPKWTAKGTISFSKSTGWGTLGKWIAKTGTSFSSATTWSMNVHLSLKAALTYATITLWNMATKWVAKLPISFNTGTSWNLSPKWNALSKPSFASITIWNMATKWVAKIADSFSSVTSWLTSGKWVAKIGDAYASTVAWAVSWVWTAGVLPQNYVIGLSYSISASWNILSHWVAHVNLASSLTTVWSSILHWGSHAGSGFHVTFGTNINLFTTVHGFIIDLSLPVRLIWSSITYHYGLIVVEHPDDLIMAGAILAVCVFGPMIAVVAMNRKRKTQPHVVH